MEGQREYFVLSIAIIKPFKNVLATEWSILLITIMNSLQMVFLQKC